MPRRRPPGDEGFKLGFESRDQGDLRDEAGLRQLHHIADVAVIAPFQLGQGQVVRFECPQSNGWRCGHSAWIDGD